MNLSKRAATLGTTLATTLLILPVMGSSRLQEQLNAVPSISHHEETDEVTEEKEPTTTVNRWIGKNFSSTESRVLEFLQERGITDRAALATILGNIRQESLFETNICEGGARTGYHRCHSGGFGLIQWTTIGRYNGLGNFSKKYGLDPNSLDAQLRWMVNEREWKLVEHHWKTPGKSINGYMQSAYRWLGWGVHGARTKYAHQYYGSLTQVQVEVPADT